MTTILVMVSLTGFGFMVVGAVSAVVLAIWWDGLWWVGLVVCLGGLLAVLAGEILLEKVDPMDWPP
jgi:hypothetical protein